MVHYHLRYILILTLFWGADGAYGFLLDINPHAFARDEPVPIYVNVLTSIRTHIPYDYYMYLPTCLPKGIALSRASNIGGLLMGDRIKPSPYGDFLVLRNVTCEIMCSGQLNSVIQQRFMRSAIIRRYRVNLLMDGLPLAEANGDSKFEIGIPLGYTLNDMYYINNHLHFTITYVVETVPSGSGSNKKRYRILSFVADPFSVDHGAKTSCTYPGEHSQSTPLSASSNNISWSYSVTWIESKEPWSTRWDLYLSVHKEKIHWYAIVNSTLLVVFLTVVVAALLIRVVRRDLRNVNDIEDEFEYMEDIGWKLLARDVFRPPPKGWLLAGLTGSGIQLLGMFFTVVLFASLGFFSPQSRGSLFTALLACFALLGVAGGYVSARFLKLWGLTKWQYVFLTGTIVPGWAFTIFLIINTVVWSQSSSAAVPFPSLASLIAIWFFVSIAVTPREK
ncbi:unnamed protein product [Trypanosoma congolense IL3000]|uniref:Transmembrane 9 superfamily member n=1 Tax=Trypanosoma congolense (strain IL3000) TaxID=1068625 RepID=F9W3K0_TRYCI|nr:unnamed protein product [Trypanosoma congolense IL3000]